MKEQILIFVTMQEKKIDLANCQPQKKKKVKPLKAVNYIIDAANCNVLTVMQCVHCLHNIHSQSTVICQQ